MPNSTASPPNNFSEDQAIWSSLKQAIAQSSGFQRWQQEYSGELSLESASLDDRVRCYLKETLATLAY